MTVTNIGQEILDWFNEPEDVRSKTEMDNEVWYEFYEAIWGTKHNRENKTATLASGRALIEEDFGGEGQGETRYVVFSVGDQFFRVEGYYASWDGTTWDDPIPFEVEAKEVSVIKYERKN